MTVEKFRQLAEKQTQEFYAAASGDPRKRQLWEARSLANFNAADLLSTENVTDEDFIAEWVNRLIQAAEILRETDLLKHLGSPAENANEAFGIEVLNAAAEEDRSRCIKLLQLGITDPENQGIYSDGIRWAVWKFIEKLEWPETAKVMVIETPKEKSAKKKRRGRKPRNDETKARE